MERTIDGIDYIAKSEVLRIIDQDISDGKIIQMNYTKGNDYWWMWEARLHSLSSLRLCFADQKDR